MSWLSSDTGKTVILLAMVAVGGVGAERLERRDDTLGSIALAMRTSGLSLEAREGQAAGYYEGLLNEGQRVSRMNPRLGGDTDAPDWGLGKVTRRGRADFLVYELNPNLNVAGETRLVTNAIGLVDRDYPPERRPGVRRIALIGDSISSGQGAAFGTSFEARLEDDLAAHPACAEQSPPEIINFAVSGYQITQLLDVLPTRVRPSNPDAYLVGLTEISVSRRWSDHLTTLLLEGRDLKYPFVRRIVREARIETTDPQRTIRAKLARFRLEMIRESVLAMKEMAEADGAAIAFLLLPSGRPLGQLREHFDGIPELLKSLEVSTVDLTTTFTDVPDLSTIRVSDMDIHPTTAGHELIFKNLRQRIDRNADGLRDLMLGSSCRSVPPQSDPR